MGNTQNGSAYSPLLSPSPAPSPAPPPLKSAPNFAPFLSFTPPQSGSIAPPLWVPPRRLGSPPQKSPSCAPAPLIFPHAVALHSKIIRHHYALIAGAAAAAVFLALLVLGVLVLKRKKLPECIRANKNGLEEANSEVVAGASENANAKKDLGNNGNLNEDYVITSNVYSSPGHGRRRTNLPADLSCDRSDGVEKEQGVVVSGSGGAHEFRTDELSKSGRALGERNRDARSVRTRSFAASRTN